MFSQVQQANDIIDVINEHVHLVKKGGEMVGLCPFHDDHRPSMYVNGTKQIFKCFACGAGGDVFKFLQMRENLSFPQAIERLAGRVGISTEKLRAKNSLSATATGPKAKTTDADPSKLAKVNAWATKYFQQNIEDEHKGKYVRNYITERQITSESTKKWQLGLAINSQDDLVRAAKIKSIPGKLLADAGLIVTQRGRSNDKFVNRLMFPITDVTGRVVGFGGRAMGESGAKYINSPTTLLFDKSNLLYGLEQARHQIVATGTTIVVEGYTDCIMAHQFGYDNTVATLGTSFTKGHSHILRRYAKKIILVFDGDAAGLSAVNRALDICISQHIDVKLALVPEGKDPCDFLLTAGKKGFEKLLDDATDVFEFKWNRWIGSLKNKDNLIDHKTATEEFLQTIAISLWAGNITAINRGLITNRLSKIMGIDSKEINTELCGRIERLTKTTSYNIQNQKAQSIDFGEGLFATAQREILEILLNEPKLFKIVKENITVNFFNVPMLGQIAAILFEVLSTEKIVSLASILSNVESVEISNAIVELAQAGEEKGNFRSRLTGALKIVRRLLAQRKIDEIKVTEDKIEFLQHVCENTGKVNSHNLGMT